MPIGKLMHTEFPYCLHREENGDCLLLNRSYKPLGQQDTSWVEYGTHPSRFKIDGRSLAAIEKISTLVHRYEDGSIEKLYFYNDSCIPAESTMHWNAYQKRLSTLGKAKAMTDGNA